MSRTITASRLALWLAFLAANGWLVLLALTAPGYPMGDVGLYEWWVQLGQGGGPWVGIDTSWVYPVLALAPMVLAAIGGEHYGFAWLVLVVVLNVVAIVTVTSGRDARRGLLAGWWWTGFLVALGPIALARIDAITVPLAVIAVAIIARHPIWAGVLLAAATWMKVWPAALIGAALITLRTRAQLLFGVVATTAVITVTAVALGGAPALLSFITTQTGRGLQIEAPASAPWLWAGALGSEGSGLYYDDDILTYQVFGPGSDLVATLMTPLLAAVASALVLLAVWLLGRGVRPEALLPPFALALVTALIAVNKVGSPQFISWLAAVIILGLVSSATGGCSFRWPAVLVLAIAGLTQIVYPVLYGHLLALEPAMLAVLTARNILLFVLLGWGVHGMLRTPRRRVRG